MLPCWTTLSEFQVVFRWRKSWTFPFASGKSVWGGLINTDEEENSDFHPFPFRPLCTDLFCLNVCPYELPADYCIICTIFFYLHYAHTFYCHTAVYSTTCYWFYGCTKSLSQIPANVTAASQLRTIFWRQADKDESGTNEDPQSKKRMLLKWVKLNVREQHLRESGTLKHLQNCCAWSSVSCWRGSPISTKMHKGTQDVCRGNVGKTVRKKNLQWSEWWEGETRVTLTSSWTPVHIFKRHTPICLWLTLILKRQDSKTCAKSWFCIT